MAKPGSDNEESDDLDKHDENMKHSALTRQGKSKRSKKAWHGMPWSINCGESVDSCIIVAEIRTIKAGRVEASTSSQSNESTMEIDNHVDMTVLGSNFLPVYDF